MDGITQRAQAPTPDHQSFSKMSAPPAAGGWKVDRVGIRAADNGGFIVDCSKSRQGPEKDVSGNVGPEAPESTYQSKDYAFSSLPEVISFLQTEFGGGAPEAATMGGAVPGDYGEA